MVCYLECRVAVVGGHQYRVHGVGYREGVFPVVVRHITVVLSHGQREFDQSQVAVPDQQCPL